MVSFSDTETPSEIFEEFLEMTKDSDILMDPSGQRIKHWVPANVFPFFLRKSSYYYLAGLSPVAVNRGSSSYSVMDSHCGGFSCCRALALGCPGFCSCGAWAQ